MQIIVTDAGFAALVNAENTGTAPVLIAEIGVTDAVFTADAGDTALPSEIKRLTTFAGAAVAPDTIHVTLKDDSADVYSMRGFGLYLADGTLFALYSQPDAILEKASAAMLLLSADVRSATIDATSITFGDSSWMNPPGTETVAGVLMLATDAETIAGTDNAKGVHAKGVKALLDSRFGAGAPSAFVKGLLTLATAALIRTALELGSAALRNEGAGGLLDADKLDGQEGAYYLAWANLTGKPATFTPSAHSHAWADLTGVPAYASRWPDWTEVTGKPLTFAPSAHTHAAADITSGTFADARIAQTNVTQHQAALSIAWTQLTGKPLTFAPSAHTHDAADITSGTFANARIAVGSVTQHQTSLSIAWTQITGEPATYPPSAHTHVMADITDLAAAMALKLDKAGGTMTGGLSMGGSVAASVTDLSRHLLLHTAGYGIGVTGSSMNYKATGATTVHAFYGGSTGATLLASISPTVADFNVPLTANTLQATTSDRRLKTEIEDLRGCLETVLQLRPRSYRWIESGEADFGFIAQEHAEVLPGAVFQHAPGEDGEPGLMHVRYGKAEPLIIGALQELAKRLDALERRVLGPMVGPPR